MSVATNSAKLRLRGGALRFASRPRHVGAAAALMVALGCLVLCSPASAFYTQVPGSPFFGGLQPGAVTFSPNGALLADGGENGLSVFTVNEGGALTQASGSPLATDGTPAAVAFSPDNALLASANYADSTVSVFAVGSGGQLTPVTGSPFPTSGNPYVVQFSPDGALLAVATFPSNSETSTMSMFAVGPGGSLTPVSGSPFAIDDFVNAFAFSPNGALLAEGGDTVSVYSVSSRGGLTQVSNPTFPSAAVSIAVAFNPSGTLLATDDADLGQVSMFAVGSGGRLTQVSGSPFATGGGPPLPGETAGGVLGGVAFSPSGGQLMALNGIANTVSVFAVGSGGALTQVVGSPIAIGTALTNGSTDLVGSAGFASSPNGLFAVTNTDGSVVSVFTAGPPSVTLTTPPDDAVYTQGEVVDASYSCADDPGGPGITLCNGTVANGAASDTSTLGVHSFTVTATSFDGQRTTVTNTYVVSPAADNFGSPVPIDSGLNDPLHLTLGHFQQPGHLTPGGFQSLGPEDIAAISTETVSFVQGEGGGAFAPPVLTGFGTSVDFSDIATLTNPGAEDYVAIADHLNDVIDIGLLGPAGFQIVQKVPLGCAPVQIATGDLTGQAGGGGDFAVLCSDGEIVVVLAAPPATSGGNLTWAVSQSFSPGSVTAIATVPDSAAGGVDIVGTTLSSAEQVGLVTLLPSGASGHYAVSSQTPLVRQEIPLGIIPGLINGSATFDGFPGLIVGAVAEPTFAALADYLSHSDGTYKDIGQLPTTSGTLLPLAMATGFFGNANADLVSAQQQQHGCLIAIDTGNGRGTFTTGPTLSTCVSPTDIQVADLNGDSYDDIAYTDAGNGNGLFVLYQNPPQVQAIGSEDLVETQPTASAVGLLIQRRGKPRRVQVKVQEPYAIKRVTRTVPTLITVGHIPLGPHHKGRNTIHYRLLINGRPLPPGHYIVTLRSLNKSKHVLDLSQPIALTVDRHGHPHFGKRVLP